MYPSSSRSPRSHRTFDGKTLARQEPPSEAQYRAPVEDDGRFGSRYEDVALLGQGGMGEVRLCRDRRTEREVAIKRIDKEQRSRTLRERFLREARIQAQLDHPTVVPVYDIGVDDDGLEYFTMKRAIGVTLEDILFELRAEEPSFCARFTLQARLHVFRQVCQGIEYAHARGIIHRDLKPANVMVGELGEIYVLDWGIAKVPSRDAQPGMRAQQFKTARGVALGTPGYFSPEQSFDAESVDARADVYALGAMLFELLTLDPLHEGDDPDVLTTSTQLGASDARISVRRPELEVAPELERACVLATKTMPTERMTSVAELHAVVAGYLEGDRDRDLRRALAERHASVASEHYTAMLASGDPDGTCRERALREAGHALALDPQANAAVNVITQLMAQPPATLPREAAAMLAQQEDASVITASRGAMRGYLAFLALPMCVLLFVRVLDWLAVAAMIVPLIFATVIAMLRSRRTQLRPPMLLAIGPVLFAIAATSTLAGPYTITPALLAAYTTASTGVVATSPRKLAAWAAMCFAAATVPMLLQAMGVLPVGLQIEPGRMLIEHRISDASPTVMHAVLVIATLATIFTPMAYAYSFARQLRDTRRRLLLHMWHLRQLMPAR